MKAFSNGTFNPVALKATLVFGDLVDARVSTLEVAVSAHYNVTVFSLKDWVKDSEAKLMLCFLLHHKLRYSIGSLAKAYNVNALFLRNEVIKLYENCLVDASVKCLVDGFFCGINESTCEVLNNV